jgi:hypothetical protein
MLSEDLLPHQAIDRRRHETEIALLLQVLASLERARGNRTDGARLLLRQAINILRGPDA